MLTYTKYGRRCKLKPKHSIVAQINSKAYTFKDLMNPLNTGNPKMGTLANSEDPDEMQHNTAFHQGLHCFASTDSANRNLHCLLN